jgi:hypothetical protein
MRGREPASRCVRVRASQPDRLLIYMFTSKPTIHMNIKNYTCPSCGGRYIPRKRTLLCPSCYSDDVHETVFLAMNLLQEEMQKNTDLDEEKKMIEILDNAFINREEKEAKHLKDIILITYKMRQP